MPNFCSCDPGRTGTLGIFMRGDAFRGPERDPEWGRDRRTGRYSLPPGYVEVWQASHIHRSAHPTFLPSPHPRTVGISREPVATHGDLIKELALGGETRVSLSPLFVDSSAQTPPGWGTSWDSVMLYAPRSDPAKGTLICVSSWPGVPHSRT